MLRSADNVKRSVTVIVRHKNDCPDKAMGSTWQECKCNKSVLIYEDGVQRWKSARTTKWFEAEKFAADYLKSFDPDMIELKSLRAAKERANTTIEDAIDRYTRDKLTRLGDGGSVRNVRTLLGQIDPVTKAVVKDGHLFAWLNKQVPRPVFLSDLTADHLTDWRSSWTFKSDLTAANQWSMVESFFKHCKQRKWIAEDPTEEMSGLRTKRGNRTAVFSDDQYAKILEAVDLYEPFNVPDFSKKVWKERLLAFVELMRWSGADVVDCVQFRPASVTDGVLRYERQKTKVLGTVPLPEHVVALLRNVPLDHASFGPSMPFRSKHELVDRDVRTWQNRLNNLFKLAGIEKVETKMGRIKKPHAKMFRHTCAVWHLRHGASIFAVSKMLGHSNVATTAKFYAPFVDELEQAIIAEGRKSLEHVQPRVKRGVTAIR